MLFRATAPSVDRKSVNRMQQEDAKTRRFSWADRSSDVIAACIEVHRHLGPGLLESAYEHCLCVELAERGLQFERQVPLPVAYKGHQVDCSYRLDLIVEKKLIVEIKAVENLTKVHDAQLITYLRLSGIAAGLLINFNTAVLKDGIRRLVCTPQTFASSRLPVASPPSRHE